MNFRSQVCRRPEGCCSAGYVARLFGLKGASVALLVLASAQWGMSAGIETNALPTLSSTPPSGNVLEVMLRMTGALIVVFALFLGGIWFFKRSRLFALYQGGNSQLRVIETRSIGFRNNLVVVGYNQQRFLLSVSATGVNLVTALPDAEMEEEPAPVAVSPSSFAEQLTALVRKA